MSPLKQLEKMLRMARRCYHAGSAIQKTSLYDFHVANGGKMVNFADFYLPVQYSDQSITQSHLHTRSSASLFDVSHMLQTEITGKDSVRFFEELCTADLQNLNDNAATLTVFTNQSGGILDDLIVTKINRESLYVVSNAGRKQQDQKHMLTHLNAFRSKHAADVTIRFFEPNERALLALQGPRTAQVLQTLTPDLDLAQLYFMHSATTSVAGVTACRVTRCGYTGEDGFEISIPAFKARDIAEEMVRDAHVRLAGLGARDSLRLEAGLCLYGNDITNETTPIEAALGWLVAKTRRERADFPGSTRILAQLRDGVARKRVGFVSSGPPARHGTAIYRGTETIGEVTSGCPSPTLKKNIAIGYVNADCAQLDTPLQFKIREKLYDACVTRMPFVKANYYSKPKQ